MQSKTRKYLIIAGAVGVAGYLLYKFAKPAVKAVSSYFAPAAVTADQQVTASSYRVISARRSGMTYMPAQGTLGGTLTFSPISGGEFTRNVINEGGQISAEIAPS